MVDFTVSGLTCDGFGEASKGFSVGGGFACAPVTCDDHREPLNQFVGNGMRSGGGDLGGGSPTLMGGEALLLSLPWFSR